MVGTNITRSGTYIMTRNEYYKYVRFRLERNVTRNEYYATPAQIFWNFFLAQKLMD